jgi:hypothetical protein
MSPPKFNAFVLDSYPASRSLRTYESVTHYRVVPETSSVSYSRLYPEPVVVVLRSKSSSGSTVSEVLIAA